MCNTNTNTNSNYYQMSQNDDESWEVRAFEEDTTGNLLGCTWPPRSYTCAFCRREFRSAQALGGHMNVHRRDRARLHATPPPPPPPPLLFSNGLCLLYPLPNSNHNAIVFPNPTQYFASSKPTETAPTNVVSSTNTTNDSSNNIKDFAGEEEELDLELRLGRKSPPPP